MKSNEVSWNRNWMRKPRHSVWCNNFIYRTRRILLFRSLLLFPFSFFSLADRIKTMKNWYLEKYRTVGVSFITWRRKDNITIEAVSDESLLCARLSVFDGNKARSKTTMSCQEEQNTTNVAKNVWIDPLLSKQRSAGLCEPEEQRSHSDCLSYSSANYHWERRSSSSRILAEHWIGWWSELDEWRNIGCEWFLNDPTWSITRTT